MADDPRDFTLMFLPGADWGEPPVPEMLVDRMQEAEGVVRLGVDEATSRSRRTPFSREDEIRLVRRGVSDRLEPELDLLAGDPGALLLLDARGNPLLACSRVILSQAQAQEDRERWELHLQFESMAPLHVWRGREPEIMAPAARS